MDNSAYPETGQELDLVEHWVNLTVEDVVSQGCKLREEKSRSCVPQPVCRLANAKHRNRLPFSEDLCSFPSAKSKSRCRAYDSGTYCSSPRSPSIKGKICVPKCPLRIAELAVPTKRQCIETWRSKCDVLPPFMVERLKAQVMDERPLAHIADAVNCFKRGKPSKGKSSKLTKRHLKSDRNSRIRDERMSELRRLCSTFGKKIAQKLITPQNLKLNPELSKISKIVADEVANMMKSDRFKSENLNEQMRAEISEKIAVWISAVMEDTSYKLLEEDLRAKRQTDMHNRDEQLITLVKLISRSERTSELEEEEGPVLDFLDDVFDKVVNICIPQEVDVPGDYSEKTSQASGESRDMSNVFDASSPYKIGDSISIDESKTKLSIGDIQNVINNVIDSVVNDDTEAKEPTSNLVDKEELSDLVPIEVITSKDEITNEVNEQLDETLYYDTKETPETVDVSKVMPVEDFTVPPDNLELNKNSIDELEASKPLDKDTKKIPETTDDSDVMPIEDFTEASDNLGLNKDAINNSEASKPLDYDTKEIPKTIDVSEVMPVEDFPAASDNLGLNTDPIDNSEASKPLNYDTTEILENSEPETINGSKVMPTEDFIVASDNLGLNKDPIDNSEASKPLNYDTTEILENSEPETINGSKVMPTEDFIVASDNLGLNKDPIDNSEASKLDNNTIDVFGIAEESNDDKDKKVQFLDIDLGHRRLDKNGKPLLESPSAKLLHDKVFQPPNENLLSDVDERWPEEITSQAITTSVSMSVTSLGNILENEEKLSVLIPENQLKSALDNEDMKNIEEKEEKALKELLQESTLGIINKHDTHEVAAHASGTIGKHAQDKDHLSGMDKAAPLPYTSAEYTRDHANLLQRGEHILETQRQKGIEDYSATKYSKDLANILPRDKSTLGPDKQKGIESHKRTEYTRNHANLLQRSEHTLETQRQKGIEDYSATKYSKDLANILPRDKSTLGPDKQKGIERHKRTEGGEKDTEVIYQAGQQQAKTSHDRPEQKFNYKVDPSTAPSWLRDDHGRGEPSVFSMMGGCRPKAKLEEQDIRLWCKDLEHMFSNLDLWNSWLETTCVHILCLKRKRDTRDYPEKDAFDLKRKIYRKMVILKKDIDKDAKLWTKLYERANKSLNAYKTKMTYSEYAMLCDCKNCAKRKL